ncbi:hypothetical protein C9374_014191 [Naegleria lovaniensis]|uniref:ABC transporter domain-containing protein n=1 Tax=Naegleria lovaniensis TaxID=51637 RepID=A0AA88H0U7_NAELO|nr:uncharacterized protein C9374_014191 [Naegleria lovaniensis]KAG2389631.1 hypothetical protein C9374_014191 [Naegleria lovaniensis]
MVANLTSFTIVASSSLPHERMEMTTSEFWSSSSSRNHKNSLSEVTKQRPFTASDTPSSGICINGTTSWLQDICVKSNDISSTSIRPSYCQYINPYVVPYPFSDHDFNTMELDPDCFDSETGKPSDDLQRAECITVQAISSAEFGPFYVSVHNNQSNETNRSEFISKRYSLFGMNTGEIYAIDFNSNELYPFLTVNQTSSKDPHEVQNDSISKLDAFVLGVNNTAAYVVSADKQQFMRIFYVDIMNPVMNSKLCKREQVGGRIEDFKSVKVGEDLYLVTLISHEDDEDSQKYHNKIKTLKFSKLGLDCLLEMNAFEYTLDLSGMDSSELNFYTFTQSMNNTERLSPSIYVRDTQMMERNLIVLQTPKTIHIVNFVESNAVIEIGANTSLSYLMFSLNAEMIENDFYISSSAVMTEELRRIDFSDNTTNTCTLSDDEKLFPSQEVHLLVTLYSNTLKSNFSKLVVRNLPEFASFVPSQDFNRTLSPVSRNDELNCDISNGYYFDSILETCSQAHEYLIELPSKALQIHSRFIDLPQAVKDYLTEASKQSSEQSEKIQQAIQFICLAVAGGDVMNPTKPFNVNQYLQCMETITNRTLELQCQAQAFGALGKDSLKEIMNDYLQYNVFIALDNNAVLIYGIQQRFCDRISKELIVKPFNQFQLIGKPIHTYISSNGQHIFISITRKKWEIESLKRYQEICNILENDPDHVFLKDYRTSCIKSPPKPININTFGFYISSCFPGMYCPSLTKNEMYSVQDRFYTERPNALLPCPIGSFCTLGSKHECPYGFICDEVKMNLPKPCTDNHYNCAFNGLTEPQAPQKGLITLAPYFPEIPIGPGLYVERTSDIDLTIKHCNKGDYCPLARAIDVGSMFDPIETTTLLECPQGTFCENSLVMTPEICFCNATFCTYCPNGSYIERACPAGFYCLGPSNIKTCKLTQYCPEGTFIPQTCEAGYYCENPKVRKICPKGHFCPSGTVRPHPCGWLSLCSEGQSSVGFNILGFFFIFICLILVFSINVGIKYVRARRAKKRDLKEKEEIEMHLSSINTNVNNREARTAYADRNMSQHYGSNNLGVNIEFENLSLTVEQAGEHKIVLNNVSGMIKHSELTGIMGCSGSGKTSFITSLSGRAYYGQRTGKVKLNGQEDDLTRFKKLVGFVPQNDIMLPSMTVYETLYFAAKCRLDKSKTNEQVENLVSSIISVLGLEDVKHSLIGDEKKRGISGGQKKRVNIGMELSAVPSVLFLDEPTSGLDSSTSKEIIEILRSIAVNQHLTIVTVIHQPRYEIFTMFHKIMLLGKGGRVVYFGPSVKAMDYFQSLGFQPPVNVNPADFMLDIISGNVSREQDTHFDPEQLFEMWEERSHLWSGDNSQKTISVDNSPAVDASPTNLTQHDLEESNDAATDSHHTQISHHHREDSHPSLSHQSEDSMDCSYEALKQEHNSRHVSYFSQFIMCLKRCIFQSTRETKSFVLDCFLVYIAGLAIGVIFYDTRYIGPPLTEIIEQCPEAMRYKCALPVDDPIITMGAILSMGLALCGVMSSLSNFGDEIVVFIREYESNISPLMYFLAKNLMQIPIIFLTPGIFISIFYIISNPQGDVWQYYLVLFNVNFVSYGIGYLLSTLFPSSFSKVAGVVFVVINNLIAGMRPTIPQMNDMFFPMPYIYSLSYLRYATEALYLFEVKKYTSVYSVESGMELLGYQFSDQTKCVWILPLFGIFYRILAYLSLVLLPPGVYVKKLWRGLFNYKQHWKKMKEWMERKRLFSARGNATRLDSHQYRDLELY